MSLGLTEQDFAEQVNTKFRIKLDATEAIELELAEVKSYAGNPGDQEGLERFSLFFTAPAGIRLPQGTFALDHVTLGELTIFLVPVQHHNGIQYEAVFNYFR